MTDWDNISSWFCIILCSPLVGVLFLAEKCGCLDQNQDHQLQQKPKFVYETCSQCHGVGKLACGALGCSTIASPHCLCGNRCFTCGATGYQQYINWNK